MTRLSRGLCGALFGLCLSAPVAFADDFTVGAVTVSHPWARATPGGAQNGAAYLTVTETGAEADRLVKAATPAAQKAELHVHLMEDGVMKMRPVEDIDVPPAAPVELKPGGLHIMLLGLTAPLKEGDSFPLTLTFAKAGEITVPVHIEGVAASMPHGAMEMHGDMNMGGQMMMKKQ